MAKVIAIAFLANQVLTSVFTLAAQQIDPQLSHQTIWVFSCMTCGLFTLWLQSDARRAYGFAREKGYVKAEGNAGEAIQIATDCPKRWLVILHIELNPATLKA
ncbi:hypothetical protein [Trinickia mobilis]|uniref:hypothetical protein n=1 Tax=Trinickia mobilis TaxID=2816356 RepID=UPI001F5DEF7A|nr:hypothetical protein [Trinickia mobilis]